jgi:hypothetical protein
MTLDVKIMRNIDLVVFNPDLSEKVKQDRVYNLINSAVVPSDGASSKQEYIKYYVRALRDYKARDITDQLDLYKKDI